MVKQQFVDNKFSVLMSVYSKEEPVFFEEAIYSVVNNTIAPDDIVVVVDGPIPSMLERSINKLKEQYLINVVYLEENVGLGKALNIGINHCKYDLIMRMDTDDYCIKTRFQEQLNYFAKHENIALLGGHIAEYDESMSKCIGIRVVPCEYHNIKMMAKKRNPFNHMTVAFRKSVILSVGGYKHHLYMEDYNLWLRVIAGGYSVANIPNVLVKVRAGENMLSRRKGLIYIHSEYLLYKLKHKLGIDNYTHGLVIFLLRALTRVLPISYLKFLYSKLRRTH
ncbi:TPA: glycosyltransferase [Citrobacter farmeri]